MHKCEYIRFPSVGARALKITQQKFIRLHLTWANSDQGHEIIKAPELVYHRVQEHMQSFSSLLWTHSLQLEGFVLLVLTIIEMNGYSTETWLYNKCQQFQNILTIFTYTPPALKNIN